jgi:hypothetical protein
VVGIWRHIGRREWGETPVAVPQANGATVEWSADGSRNNLRLASPFLRPILDWSPSVNEKRNSRQHAAPTFAVGSRVYVQFGTTKRVARIVEDRGRIGREGRRLLRVAFTRADGGAEQVFEIPADEVTHASAQPRTSRVAKSNVA